MTIGYDNQSTNSSKTVIALIVLAVLVPLTLFLVLGTGGWFYLRSSRMQQVAMEQRDRAMRAEQMARAMAERAARVAEAQADQARQLAAEVKAESADKPVPGSQVTIELDQAGKLRLNGEAIELPRLLDSLKALAADETNSITVDVRADNECRFQNVAALISACQEVGHHPLSLRHTGCGHGRRAVGRRRAGHCSHSGLIGSESLPWCSVVSSDQSP